MKTARAVGRVAALIVFFVFLFWLRINRGMIP